jgi:predicted negative regulator of RcsB-dependent stress response
MSSKEAFDASLFLADKLVNRGDYADAVTAMHPWVFADVSDWNKTIIAYNLAQVFIHMGQHDHAIVWFDYGIDLEQPLARTLVAEGKAAYLHGKGRVDEAVAIWSGLLAGTLLDADGRRRVETNLRTVTGKG